MPKASCLRSLTEERGEGTQQMKENLEALIRDHGAMTAKRAEEHR